MISNKNKNLLKFAFLIAIFTWGILAYIKLGEYFNQGILLARYINGRPYISDFASYYNAACLTKRCLNEKVDIYDIAIQQESLKKLVAPVVPELPFHLQYPPYFFVLVLPLAFFSISYAWLIWVILGIGLSTYFLYKIAGKDFSRKEKHLIAGLTLCTYPAWLTVELGQVSLYLLPALASTFILLESHKKFSAGFTSAINVIKLQYYPFLGLIGLLLGQIHFFAGALCLFIILLVASISILGPGTVLNYPQALAIAETSPMVSGVSAESMQNFRGVLTLLCGDEASIVKYLSCLLFVFSLIFLGWLWLGLYKRFAQTEKNAFKILAAISVLLMLIFSLHTHCQDYLLMAISCVWLWKWSKDRQESKPNYRMRLLQLMILAYIPLSWFFFFGNHFLAACCIQPFFTWACFLLVLSLAEIFAQLSSTKQK